MRAKCSNCSPSCARSAAARTRRPNCFAIRIRRWPVGSERARQDVASIGSGLGGVYTSMPAELLLALLDRQVVVAGGGFDAALRLAAGCTSVTFITTATDRIKAAPANVKVHYG